MANAQQQSQRSLGELTMKLCGEMPGEVRWRSAPAKCAARHQAKHASKFPRNFVTVELLSRKFYRNSIANFTATTSQTHQAQQNAERFVGNRSGPWGLVVLTGQSAFRKLRSHSCHCEPVGVLFRTGECTCPYQVSSSLLRRRVQDGNLLADRLYGWNAIHKLMHQ